MGDSANYPITIALSSDRSMDLPNAVRAVREEYRGTTRWKRLRCRSVSLVDNDPDTAIYVLRVGNSVELDWTWEGAFAFRPSEMTDIEDTTDIEHILEAGGGVGQHNSNIAWYGEVVEINEADGEIYVSAPDSEQPPCAGAFYIRPFEFMETLHTLYTDPEFEEVRRYFPTRLNACRGEQHPRLTDASTIATPALANVWKHGWGVLWGPPGTGKTYTIGQHVAACLGDPTERILVVSTTNKATDVVALRIGEAAKSQVAKRQMVRIGKNADYEEFHRQGLDAMLSGSEVELLRTAVQLRRQLKESLSYEESARIRQQLQRLRQAIKDRALEVFLADNYRVVIATAFRALTLLKEGPIRHMLEEGRAPFTSVIIDEAGLLSRVTTAALSLLAARRVLLVGDPKQLAPISKMSRVLPTDQTTWLAKSSLSHLSSARDLPSAVHLLTKQYRMHPDIRRAVSEYQYDGLLEDGNVIRPSFSLTRFLGEKLPHAIWYVLDEEGKDLPSIRAERGPANRSWIRPITPTILDKLLQYPQLHERDCLFISPFAAQAKSVGSYLAHKGVRNWSASTVHSQQGAEADVVVFDTVNASSTAWPLDEWQRLINVGISRAKDVLIVLASRAEMRQPFLRPLADLLTPYVAQQNRQETQLKPVSGEINEYKATDGLLSNTEFLGNQITSRKLLRPVLSVEQQRLSGYRMDGKPRLVRGVAGSGKTMVLANWLNQIVQNFAQNSDDRIWAVYANYALKGLIEKTVQEAWSETGRYQNFPWERVVTIHVDDILRNLIEQMRRDERVSYAGERFDYDAKAAFCLMHRPIDRFTPTCSAMFIDEAQDMGPNTLRLLTALVQQTDSTDPNSRAVNIFYDNAQNVYSRATPKWTDLGLDMRGRSTVMKESFRSTKPITEYALNVLYRLQPPHRDPDHRELVERSLLEQVERNQQEWWQVRFAQTNGPTPSLRKFASLNQQIEAIAVQIIDWVKKEAVAPGDICLLCNGQDVQNGITGFLRDRLRAQGIELQLLKGRDLQPDPNIVLASTTQSFKGYDAEIVVVVSADRFVGGGKILANVLYTAMTRARSVLAVYTDVRTQSAEGQRINHVLEQCLDTLLATPDVEDTATKVDDITELLEIIGSEHHAWLESLWQKYDIQQEPLIAGDGQILAEPAFWFESERHIYTCFGRKTLGASTRHQLEDRQIFILQPGQSLA